jgi:plastocyanin
MTAAIVWLVVVSIALVSGAEAAELTALIKDQKGEPVSDAVVVAVSKVGAPPLPARPGREVVDQIDKEFVPYVKAILVGSPVNFPNKDNIRHHVYSFSRAKTFELPLYSGTPAHPVVFDRPGVVTIGCNIHDWMIAYIYVEETPYFATTGRDGRVKLDNLPPGAYAVRVWHPRLEGAEESTARTLTVGPGAMDAAWQVTLRQGLRPRRAPVPGQRGYR